MNTHSKMKSKHARNRSFAWMLALGCLAWTHPATAQDPIIEWVAVMDSMDLGTRISDIALDASGNVYTTGNFGGTVDFDPGPGTFNLTSEGERSVFVCKLDAAGNFVWAKAMEHASGGDESPGVGQSTDIALDASGNVYTRGWFIGTLDFDPGPGTFELTVPETNEGDVFVSKLDSAGNFVWAVIAQPRSPFRSGDDEADIAVDGSGNVYFSADGPILWKLSQGGGEGEPQPALRVAPTSLSVSSDAGTFEVGVTNAGDGVLDWNAEVILGESWLSLDAVKVQGDGTLRGSHAENGLFVERIGTIRVTAIGALGSPTDITITQAEAAAVISATPEKIDFGVVDFGSSVTGSATITNSGDAAIEGMATTSPPFTVESGEACTLLPGESHEVVVRFTPMGNGAVMGALLFSGGGGAVVELAAEGIGETPGAVLSVAAGQIEFGAVEVGLSATETLAIANEGENVLQGGASTSPPYSIVSGQAYTLFPGGSHQVAVRFPPTESGTATGSLSLSGGGGAIVELVGEGMSEEPGLCGSIEDIGAELELFKAQFGIESGDFDGDGLPEEFVLALLGIVCNRADGDGLRNATRIAYDLNLMALENEEDYGELQEYRHALAALMMVSMEMQSAVSNALFGENITLAGTYESVTGAGGVYMPSEAKGLSISEGYLTFDAVMKAENEPYSASGDLDEDGFANMVEYQNILAWGGTAEDFAIAANDPATDGSQTGGGEGEGEGSPPVCGALWRDGAPISGYIGDLALLTLFLGAMLFHRRRRRTEP